MESFVNIQKIKIFKIENTLNLIVNIYNNTIITKTKYKPYDIYYSDDENLFKEVKENTLKSFKNYYSIEALFNINDPVLVFNNFEKSYNKKKVSLLSKSKLKKKNSLYNIYATVVNIIRCDEYEILIESYYIDYVLKKI